jgi:predicted HTH domain antitoxin
MFEKEHAVLRANFKTLLEKYDGKAIVIDGDHLYGAYDTFGDLKRFVGVKLYLDHSVGIAKAADIAGMGRADFEQYLGSHEIPISLLGYKDVQNDLKKIRSLRQAGKLPQISL